LKQTLRNAANKQLLAFCRRQAVDLLEKNGAVLDFCAIDLQNTNALSFRIVCKLMIDIIGCIKEDFAMIYGIAISPI